MKTVCDTWSDFRFRNPTKFTIWSGCAWCSAVTQLRPLQTTVKVVCEYVKAYNLFPHKFGSLFLLVCLDEAVGRLGEDWYVMTKEEKWIFWSRSRFSALGRGISSQLKQGEGRQGPGRPDEDLKSLGFRLKPCLLWLVRKILDVQTIHCDQHSTLLKWH